MVKLTGDLNSFFTFMLARFSTANNVLTDNRKDMNDSVLAS